MLTDSLCFGVDFPRKFLRLAAAAIAVASTIAFAQGPAVAGAPPSATRVPAFDVATIKPHTTAVGGDKMFGVMNTPSGLSASSATLASLVRSAYALQAQVAGGEDWVKTEIYDLQAKMSEADIAAMTTLSAADQKTRRQLMLQALLADRFKLKTHSETKQVPVFDLVTTKDTSKLKVANPDPDAKTNKDGTPSGSLHIGQDSVTAVGESMAAFAGFLSGPMSGVGRPVVDKTGLTLTYTFTLNWSLSSARAAITSGAQEDDTASIFGALKEVGLKLQPSIGPMATIVIDHAERPTAN